MPKLIAALVRHGNYHQLADTPSAHQPFPLNQEGEQQAGLAVAWLSSKLQLQHWRLHPVIDSSRLLRAWQTATIIGNGMSQMNPVIEGFDALAERGVGSAANLTIRQIEKVIDDDPRFATPPVDWKSNSHYRLPLQGAESLLEAGQRVAHHIQQRMNELRHQTTQDTIKLFVGHGAAFRHAAFHLGVLEFTDIARLSMYHAQPVCLELTDSGQWQHIAGEWKVRKAQDQVMD